ncbi:MAG: polysaccharide biosynthesis protein [Tissierellaceae bacterium]|nr:polysaccharide biosynthesis protein [Tissierellaceae bacterium]
MSKGNNFIKGAAILGIAGVIVKILGAIYRIPLGNIIKPEGMGYYQTAYPFYVLLLTISTSGVPVAIAKLVSEKSALGDYKSAYKVFKVALAGLFIAGVLTSLFVFFNAKSIVNSLGNPNAYYSLLALVPALFFVPIMAAYRGYFQGRQNMVPTALSQISEQFFRVILGLGITYLLLDYGIPVAAGGASFGGSIGAIAGTISIYAIFLSKKKVINEEIRTCISKDDYEVSAIVKDLLTIAVPITIGAAIAPIMDTIDASMVIKRLQTINYTKAQANELYGQLKGYAQTLINLPQIFSISIAMSLVPAISNAKARKQKKEIEGLIGSGIRMTLLIGLPCAFGLFVLARPIIQLLYFNNTQETITSIGEILQYLSFGVIFLTLVQALTSMLQGLGKPLVPVVNLFIGAAVKVGLTYTLTVIPSINVKGAAISTVAAYAIASILDLISLSILTKMRFNYMDTFIKPLISSVGMAIVVKLSYVSLYNILGSSLATLISVMIGVIAYVILLIITGTITNEDLALLPKGDKIAKKLDKFNFMR